jgi:hypothetical protein
MTPPTYVLDDDELEDDEEFDEDEDDDEDADDEDEEDEEQETWQVVEAPVSRKGQSFLDFGVRSA